MDPTELDQMMNDALADTIPADVTEWLDTPGTPDAPEAEPPPWEIDGERTATWVLRKLRALEAERAAADALIAEQERVLAGYRARVYGRTERHLAYFTGRLRHYHDRVLAENPKAKTLDLPGAQLKRRAGGVTTDVTDPDALRAWLEDHDAEDLLEYPDPRVRKADVKARYGGKVADEPGAYPAVDALTGEVLPGVQLVRAVPSETVAWIDTPADEAE